MTVRAVGFDLDDTLCVPNRDRAVLLEEAVDAVGAPPNAAWASRSAYREAHRGQPSGRTRAPVFEAMLEGAAASVDADRLARTYRERVNDSLRAVEGVAGLLSWLRERYRVGLLTNGPVIAQRSKLERLGWTDAFDLVLVTGELEADKPDGRAFRALWEGLDVSPGELVYVGDDVEADIAGATAAGCRAIQVLHDGGSAPDPRAVAHLPVTELAEALPETLRSLD